MKKRHFILAALITLAPLCSEAVTPGRPLVVSQVITPTALSGSVNNYSPTGLVDAFTVRIDGGASNRNITGLAASSTETAKRIVNIGTTNNLTLVNNSGSSSAGNKFILGADVVLTPGTAMTVVYDLTSACWRALSSLPSASGFAASGANTDITSVLLNQTGLVVKSATSSTLTLKPNESLTGNRVLNLILNDADRTMNLGGNLTLAGALTTSGAFGSTFTMTGTTTVTFPTSGTLATTGVATLSSLASIGTITTGTWNASVIAGQYGGTGVANTGKTITLGGNLTTSGSFALTVTLTGTTGVTLPTSGTLAVNNQASDTFGALTDITTNNVSTTAHGFQKKLPNDGSVYMDGQGNYTKPGESFVVAVGDETTAITTGTAKVTFRMPYAFTLTAVRASVTTASSSGLPTVNIKESGTTILSTNLSIDASEKTSTTAATPAVISDSSLADDAEMTIDITVAGTGAAGLKVEFIGHKT